MACSFATQPINVDNTGFAKNYLSNGYSDMVQQIRVAKQRSANAFEEAQRSNGTKLKK
jgi:hypothetical protein